jgi:hypothetical protein
MCWALTKGWLLWVFCGVLAGILLRWVLNVISFEQFKFLMVIWPVGGVLVCAAVFLQIKLGK